MGKHALALVAVGMLATSMASASIDLESFTIEPSVPGTQIFRSIGAQGAPGPEAGPGATVAWPVTVDLALLDTLPPTLQVNFADRASVTLTRLRSARRGPASLMWTGRGGDCSAFFRRAADSFKATISCLNGQYGVDGELDTGVRLTRYDGAGLDFEEPLAEAPVMPAPDPEQLAACKGGDDTTVDVLVLFNGNLANTPIWLFAQDAIDQTQLAMDDSTSPGQPPIMELRLAGAARIARAVNNDPENDLDVLRTDSETIALRNYWAADVIVYITLSTLNIQGIANIPGYLGRPLPSCDFAPWAIAVVVSDHAIGSEYVFAHEFAHTFGANHNPDHLPANPTPIEDYAWGHWMRLPLSTRGNRTIMSYRSECTGNPCPRILNYSNPDVWVDTFHTGMLNERDNAKLLKEIAPIQAQYRISVGRIFAHGFE